MAWRCPSKMPMQYDEQRKRPENGKMGEREEKGMNPGLHGFLCWRCVRTLSPPPSSRWPFQPDASRCPPPPLASRQPIPHLGILGRPTLRHTSGTVIGIDDEALDARVDDACAADAGDFGDVGLQRASRTPKARARAKAGQRASERRRGGERCEKGKRARTKDQMGGWL